MSKEIKALNQALRERIQAATDAALQEKKYDAMKDEIKQAFTDYFAQLQQGIPKYEAPVRGEEEAAAE